MVSTIFPETIINEIRDHFDLVDIVSQYVSLKKSGENHKGLCPFHPEKTPSFTISTKKQIFHCFGCHVGGNIYSFIMKIEGYSFPQAVRFLAEKAGISLPAYPSEERSKKDILLEINNLAIDFYRENLKKEEAKKAYSYLKERGITNQTIDKFKLGYALPSWDKLYRYLSWKGISAENIEEAGLSIKKREGYYDRFRDRLIFPTFNLQNRILGFGARVLNNNLPKYINSPETLIYNKSQILYGLNFAKEAIRLKEFLILVEGYFDVITSYQLGILNVTAILGTSLTEDHAQIIKRYANKVVIIYDPDNAGIKATIRSLDIFLEKEMVVQIVTLPERLDPAEFLLKKGVLSFNRLINNACDFLDYKIAVALREIDIKKAEGKGKLIKTLKSTYLKLKSPLQQTEFVKKIADKLNIAEEVVLLEISFKPPFVSNKTKESFIQEGEKRSLMAEKGFLRVFFQDLNLTNQIMDKIEVDDFEDSECKAIYSLILKKIENQENIEFKKIIDDLTPSQNFFISEIGVEESKVTSEEIKDYINYFYNRRLAKKVREIKKKEKDGIIDQKLIQECFSLRKEIEKIKKEK
ncbi:MAG: DNA primase [bacterium]